MHSIRDKEHISLENDGYYSFRNNLSSRLLSVNVYRIIIYLLFYVGMKGGPHPKERTHNPEHDCRNSYRRETSGTGRLRTVCREEC